MATAGMAGTVDRRNLFRYAEIAQGGDHVVEDGAVLEWRGLGKQARRVGRIDCQKRGNSPPRGVRIAGFGIRHRELGKAKGRIGVLRVMGSEFTDGRLVILRRRWS